MAQAMGTSSLSSPSRLLAELEKSNAGASEPPLQELLESVQRRQGGGAAAAQAADRLEVFPEPGFVVKTANEQGQKVFINVCGSAKMPLPSGWARGAEVPAEVKRHLEEAQGGEAPPSMRFPLSMGAARIDTDHRGEACLVLDCILSSELLAACAAYRPLKLFLIQLALALAAQQTGLELDPQYRLPKMRFKGGDRPLPQMIQLDPSMHSSSSTAGNAGAGAFGSVGEGSASQQAAAGDGRPLIAEVTPQEEGEEEEGAPGFALLASKRQQRQQSSAAALQQQNRREAAQTAAAAAATRKLSLSASQAGATGAAADARRQGAATELQPHIEYVGTPATAVSITLPLPPAAASAAAKNPSAIQASVCAETVRLQVPGCQHVDVRLPFAVSTAGGRAELAPAGAAASAAAKGAPGAVSDSKGGWVLRLHLPYRPFGSVLEELQQAQAAAAADGQGQYSLEDLD